MLRRLFAALALLAAFAVAPTVWAQSAPGGCQYILGFKTLHDLDPADVGNCTDNQAFAANGDAQQQTTKGLMAWRKADNWTAFTNGYWTWINGPYGLAKRLNVVRFPWEANAGELPVLQADGSLARPTVSPIPSAFVPLPSSVGTTVDWQQQSLGNGRFHAVVKAVYLTVVLPTVYSSYGEVEDHAIGAPGNGVFAVFVLAVTNTGNASGTVYDNDLAVADAQGRMFTSDQTPDGAFITLKDRLGTKGVADSLGPSLTDIFSLVYVVTPDATGLHLMPATP